MLSTNRIEWCCARGRLLYRGGVLAFWCHLCRICGNLLNGATVSGKFKKVGGWQNRSNLTLQIYSSPRHVVIFYQQLNDLSNFTWLAHFKGVWWRSEFAAEKTTTACAGQVVWLLCWWCVLFAFLWCGAHSTWVWGVSPVAGRKGGWEGSRRRAVGRISLGVVQCGSEIWWFWPCVDTTWNCLLILGVQDLGNQDQIAPDRNSKVLFVGLEAEEKSRSWPPPPFDFEAQFAWKWRKKDKQKISRRHGL